MLFFLSHTYTNNIPFPLTAQQSQSLYETAWNTIKKQVIKKEKKREAIAQ